MPVLIDVAAQDFPDAAQRFNWCNCQKEAPALTAALGDVPPAALTAPAAITPIFDFSFWDSQLTGGGGALPTNQTGAPGNILSSAANVAGSAAGWLLPGALAVGALWFFTARKKGGRRR